MKSILRVSIGLVVLAVPFLTGCEKSRPSVAASNGADASTQAEKIHRGEYLVKTIGCNDCHTPLKMTDKGPVPDMTRMLSGHPESLKMPRPPQLADGPWGWVGSSTMTAFYGPWGVSYAVNLTPDNATGLGIWTEDMFIKTMRLGKHMGTSRPVNPPMPWQNIGQLTDDDIKALFAYLKSIPPIHNQVPTYLEPSEVATTLK
jgi:cytochrome c